MPGSSTPAQGVAVVVRVATDQSDVTGAFLISGGIAPW
jgi:hypothetical protein